MHVCFCCVCFRFFSTKPRDWLGRTSPKWLILCRVGRKTQLYQYILSLPRRHGAQVLLVLTRDHTFTYHPYTCHAYLTHSSVTFTQRASPHFGWFSFFRPAEDRRLSSPRWLVTYRGGLPALRLSPIPVLTGFAVEKLLPFDAPNIVTAPSNRNLLQL